MRALTTILLAAALTACGATTTEQTTTTTPAVKPAPGARAIRLATVYVGNLIQITQQGE